VSFESLKLLKKHNVLVVIWKTYSSLLMKENPTMAHLGIGKEKSGRRDKSRKGGKCEEAMERGWKRQSWKRGKNERKKEGRKMVK
jgi:hypothetical protein